MPESNRRPIDCEFKAEWGAYQKNVDNTNTGLGFGKKNTEIIVAFLRQIGESGKAAQLCAELDIEGYTDWFLPSKEELNLMYTNLKSKGLGNFQNVSYWSSSEYLISAWLQDFTLGYLHLYSNDLTLCVRAVRAF